MKKLVGVFATVALFGSGAAFAQDSTATQQQQDPAAAGSSDVQQGSGMQQDSATQSDPAIGGSGSSGATQTDPATGGSGSPGSTQGDPAIGGSGSSSTGSATGSAMGSQNAMGQKELTGKVVKAGSKMVWVDMQGAVVPLKVDKSTQFNDPTLKGAKDLKEGQEIRASYEVKETDNVAKSISMSGTGGSGSGDMMSPDSSINEGTGGSGLEQDKDVDMNTGGSGMDTTTPPSGNTDINSGSSTMNPDSSGGTDTH